MPTPPISMRRAAATAMLAGAIALPLAGCDDSKAAPPPAKSGVPVSTAQVIARDIMETQEFSGRMEAVEEVAIRARVGGYITAINFTPGGRVRKGDVLVVIDTRPYQAEAARAEAAAAAARAKAELAQVELHRAEALLADKAIAQREYDEKASGLKELAANARAAEAQAATARLNLDYTKVVSPIDGRVSKAEITLGNLVDAASVLTSVVSTRDIYASFDGDEDTYLRVARQAQQGKAVTVKVGLANETGFPHQGKLEFVDNKLDARSGSVRMRAVFANEDQALAPGLFARVQVGSGAGAGQASSALLVNERAIGTDQSHKYVVVVGAGGKAEFRNVTLGPVIDGLRVVRAGLKAGENVVIAGVQRVRPGDVIAANKVAMDYDPSKKVAAAGKEQAP